MAFSDLFSFLTVLKESIKILPRNGKLIAFLAICSIVLYSAIFLLFNYTFQLIINDMQAAITQTLMPHPTSPTPNAGQFDHLKEDIAFLLANNITFFLAFAILGFFLFMATAIVSAKSYISKTMSFNDLLSLIRKTWIKTLITTLYVSGLSLGYSFCLMVLVLGPFIMYPNPIAMLVAAVISVPAMILYLYLSVCWILAIVVSVVEEDCYGADALARAGRLVQGKRLQGVMLILFFNLVAVIILRSNRLATPTVYGIVAANVSWLLKMMLMVAYTVLYFECKKHHGDQIVELHGSVQYAKMSTAAPDSDIV